MSDNQKIIRSTVMKTLYEMFIKDDLNYRQLKKACIEYPDFKIKIGEYKDMYVLYPNTKNAIKAFIKVADNMHIEKPYIFIGYVKNEWTANSLYATYKNTKHDYCHEFNKISDQDINKFMEKLYNFIFN